MERRHSYGVGIGVTGLVLTAIQLVQGIQQLGDVEGLSGTDGAIVFAFGSVPFVLVGLALVYAGYWVTGQTAYEPDLDTILAWGVGSTVLFVSVAALLVFNQRVALGTFEQGQYLVIDQLTVGAVVGILVGVYDARSRARQRELERERDRIESFAGKAADMNNYGRELNRAGSIEEVSALCIEGLQTLLGLTETGFVAVDDEGGSVVNNTIVNVDAATLVELAAAADTQQPATVEFVEGSELGKDERILSILVTRHDDTAVVLLSLTGGSDSFEEEDVQLVELLCTHAGTALDRIYDEYSSTAEPLST